MADFRDEITGKVQTMMTPTDAGMSRWGAQPGLVDTKGLQLPPPKTATRRAALQARRSGMARSCWRTTSRRAASSRTTWLRWQQQRGRQKWQRRPQRGRPRQAWQRRPQRGRPQGWRGEKPGQQRGRQDQQHQPLRPCPASRTALSWEQVRGEVPCPWAALACVLACAALACTAQAMHPFHQEWPCLLGRHACPAHFRTSREVRVATFGLLEVVLV